MTAAAHILETQGLAGFNTNAIADRAGVSIGSLYQYFPGKDAILAALIERRTADFAERLAALANAAAGASRAEDLRLLLTQAVAWHSQSARLSQILDAEERRLADCLDLEPAHTRFQSSLARLLRRHDSRGAGDWDEAAGNVTLILKALMESEGEAAEPDWPIAIERAIGAVLGYLAIASPGDASRLTQSIRSA